MSVQVIIIIIIYLLGLIKLNIIYIYSVPPLGRIYYLLSRYIWTSDVIDLKSIYSRHDDVFV